jgi:hypothetical protein
MLSRVEVMGMVRTRVVLSAGLAALALACGVAKAEAGPIPYAIVGSGVEVGFGSTLTINALATGDVANTSSGSVVWTPTNGTPLEIAVDCLTVSTNTLLEPYGIGHISLGSGIGSDGVRYYFRTQKDGDTAAIGSARLSSSADLAYDCGAPTGGRFFNGPYRAVPPFAVPD